MQKFFLSYSRSDSETALKIASRLKMEGLDIWIDQADLLAGVSWPAETQKALDACDCLLFVASNLSVVSDNVLDEVYYAYKKKKRIIPIKIDSCEVPVNLTRLHDVDLSPADFEQGFRHLLKAVNLEKKLIGDEVLLVTEENEINGQAEKRSEAISIAQIREEANKEGQKAEDKINPFAVYFWLGAIILLFVGLYYLSPRQTTETDPSKDQARLLSMDSSSDYKIGLDYYSRKDFTKAFESFRTSAKHGQKNAMMYLGNMYYNGQGVTQDYSRAMEWYKKAADGGNAAALKNIGMLYYNGQGVIQDYTAAIDWFKKAVAAGDASSMNIMGDLFYYGQGVTQDYSKAMEWYSEAAAAGNASAMCNMGALFYYGKGVAQDYAKAMEWYRKSADSGVAHAMNNIGELFHYGRGVTADYNKAMEWYKKSADAGSALAMENIGLLYDVGKGVAKDADKARLWHRKAKQAKTDSLIK